MYFYQSVYCVLNFVVKQLFFVFGQIIIIFILSTFPKQFLISFSFIRDINTKTQNTHTQKNMVIECENSTLFLVGGVPSQGILVGSVPSQEILVGSVPSQEILERNHLEI